MYEKLDLNTKHTEMGNGQDINRRNRKKLQDSKANSEKSRELLQNWKPLSLPPILEK